MVSWAEFKCFLHLFKTNKNAQYNLEPDAPIDSSRSLFWACFVKKQFWGWGPYFGPVHQSVA